MKSCILKLWLPGLLVAAIAGMPIHIRAQDTNLPVIEKKEGKPKKNTVPFHGKLKSASTADKTITVGNVLLHVTAETRFEKAGKPAVIEDGVVGEEIGGSYRRAEDGKIVAILVRFGPKEKVEKPENTPKTQ